MNNNTKKAQNNKTKTKKKTKKKKTAFYAKKYGTYMAAPPGLSDSPTHAHQRYAPQPRPMSPTKKARRPPSPKKRHTGPQREGVVDDYIRELAMAKLGFGRGALEAIMATQELAQAYLDVGYVKQAVTHGKAGCQLCLRQAQQGSAEHQEALITLSLTLGVAYTMLGKFEKGAAALDKALALERGRRGDESLQGADIMTALATVDCKTGRFAEAVERLIAVWQIREAKHGMHSEAMMSTYLELGRAYFLASDDEKAQENLHQALKIAKAHQLSDSCAAADASALLATCLKRQAKFEDSIPHWTAALTNYLSLEGPDSQRVLRMRKEIATVYVVLEDYGAAAFHMEAVLLSQRKTMWRAEDELPLAHSYKRLGEICLLAGEPKRALRAFQAANSIFRRVFGPNHSDTILMRERILALQEQDQLPGNNTLQQQQEEEEEEEVEEEEEEEEEEKEGGSSSSSSSASSPSASDDEEEGVDEDEYADDFEESTHLRTPTKTQERGKEVAMTPNSQAIADLADLDFGLEAM